MRETQKSCDISGKKTERAGNVSQERKCTVLCKK